MPISWFTDAERRFRIGYLPSDATIDEFAESVRTHVWPVEDFAAFDEITVFANLARLMETAPPARAAEIVASLYGSRRDARTALVVRRQVDFGMLRMYAAYRERDEHSLQVFYDIGQALDWFGFEGTRCEDYLAAAQRLVEAGGD
ncbi:MAG: hypothetical protein V2I63_00120 [Pseudomonadales bacterium]|jgi:hypothetical protein|nr:hypothetical protein [Pseudomonadales bacterium]